MANPNSNGWVFSVPAGAPGITVLLYLGMIFWMVRWWNVEVVQTVWWLWCNVRYTVTQIYTDDRYSIVLHHIISVCYSHWEPGKHPDEPSGMNLIRAALALGWFDPALVPNHWESCRDKPCCGSA
jgi:hypothetical protein